MGFSLASIAKFPIFMNFYEAFAQFFKEGFLRNYMIGLVGFYAQMIRREKITNGLKPDIIASI